MCTLLISVHEYVNMLVKIRPMFHKFYIWNVFEI